LPRHPAAEIAPDFIRTISEPLSNLLSGIPSVVYGLFGMVVIAPLIRQIPPKEIPRALVF
jgi:phosphate transport system permease protein